MVTDEAGVAKRWWSVWLGLTCVVGVHLCSPVRREVIGVVQAISGLRFTVVVAMFLLWLDLWRVL